VFARPRILAVCMSEIDRITLALDERWLGSLR
jgi:hypothetical protein